MDLDGLQVFEAVVSEGSFTGAAARLRCSKSSVSRVIGALEASLGVVLFHRTTRTVALSTSGAELHARVSPHLAALARAVAPVSPGDEPRGLLRVTTTPDLAAHRVAEVAARYVERWPSARIEVVGDARLVDLAAEGFDVAIRTTTDRLPDSDLVARQLGTLRIGWFASPRYVARRGEPADLGDLARHTVVALDTLAGRDPDARGAALLANDMTTVRAALRADAGVGQLPTFLADEDVARGWLVPVLAGHATWSGTVWFVHPGRPPPKVVAFREMIEVAFARVPLTLRSDA